jgi:hypothetical protein
MITRFGRDFIVWAILLSGCNACAQETSVEAFGDELLEPIEISAMSIQSERLTGLSPRQRESLVRARAVLGEFFKSLERIDGNPRQFMTDKYARQTSDRQSLRQTLVAYETTVLQVRVTDFSVMSEDTLDLSFYATVFSEGTFLVGEAHATLRKVGEVWRVDAVEILYP